MAVALAVDPAMAPCGQCDCVNGVSPIPDKWEIPGVLKTSVCPRKSLPSDWVELMGLFRHYRNGFLWADGGVSNQPALYMDAMRLIDQWVNTFSEQKK